VAKKKADPKTSGAKSVAVRPATGDNDARVWLRANGYDDIANQIDAVMLRWKAEGKRTRRNWWEILAGDKNGNARVAGGIEFPVLRAARIRQNLPEVPNALCRDPNETPLPVRQSPRWPRKRKRRH
jgi:hypothetical protein